MMDDIIFEDNNYGVFDKKEVQDQNRLQYID